jgi:hypothetical protein
MEDGRPTYVRDGKKFDGGFLGGDIEEAVHGNPQSEEYAHEFKSGIVTGFVLSMIGAAGVVGGAVVAAAEVDQPRASNAVPVGGLAVMGAGVILDVVGLVMMLNAQPHLFDAINSYNDAVRFQGSP